MEFKKFCAGKFTYGVSNPTVNCNINGVTNVSFEDPLLNKHMEDPSHENAEYLRKFIEILGICHTIIVEDKDGEIRYNASSPDELALANAARYFGFKFIGRDEENNVVIDQNGEEIGYQLLNLIEFNSTRKRMTVVVKTPEDKIMVFCKGADSIILPLLTKNCPNVD